MMTLEECVAKAADLRERHPDDPGRAAFFTAFGNQRHLRTNKNVAYSAAQMFLYDPIQTDFDSYSRTWHRRFQVMHARAAVERLKG